MSDLLLENEATLLLINAIFFSLSFLHLGAYRSLSDSVP